MPDIQIVALKCKAKPQRPEECGYTAWSRVREAMDGQRERPLAERLRPCVSRGAWVYYVSCQTCKNSLWDLEIDGVPVRAFVGRRQGKTVELHLSGRQETLEYSISRREWRLRETEKPLGEQGPELA